MRQVCHAPAIHLNAIDNCPITRHRHTDNHPTTDLEPWGKPFNPVSLFEDELAIHADYVKAEMDEMDEKVEEIAI